MAKRMEGGEMEEEGRRRVRGEMEDGEGERRGKVNEEEEERGPTVRIGPFPSFLIAVDGCSSWFLRYRTRTKGSKFFHFGLNGT